MSAKILIVDDEVIVAESTRSLLTELGYSPTDVATDETEVFASIKRSPPDLVLMDINLGRGFEGIDIAARILERWRIPVVYATAYADDTVLSKATITHPFGFVTKPFDERDLRVAIEIALHNHAVARRLRETEQALAASEARYRQMIQATDDLVTSVDSQGHYVFVNRRFEQVFGLLPGECLGKPAFGFICECDRDRLLQWFHQATQQNDVPSLIEVRMRGADGRLREVQWTSAFRKDDVGRMVEVTSIGRDITGHNHAAQERLDAQRQLLQKHNLDSLGRMSGAVAHHFNNKLQAVIMGLSTVEPELPVGSYHRDLCREALNAAHGAAAVSRSLLAYLGQHPLRPESVELGRTVQACIPLLRSAISTRAEMTAPVPPQPTWVHADPTAIQYVLERLITNAAEAIGDDDGLITIDTGQVEAADISGGHRYPGDWRPSAPRYGFLEVKDTGCGMTPQQLENLFEPFFSTKFTGRGLGLPTVLGHVRANGGAVVVSSEPGNGSIFRVYLPSTLPPTPEIPAGNETDTPSLLSGTVLLVDDEDAVRRAAEAGLRRLGCSVVPASDGVGALALFKAHQQSIRCVLLDLTMRGMSGYETMAALRRIDPEVSIILSSGYSSSIAIDANAGVQPQAFLQKPYTIEELAAVLRSVLR